MSINKIKEKILGDALEEKGKIQKEAEIEIENIKSLAKKETESIKKEILEKYNQEADLKEKKIITEAILNTKKDILSEKQAIINNVFSEALNRINKLEDEKYLSFMEKLILENIETGDETVYIGKQERKAINHEFIKTINEKLNLQGKKSLLELSKKRLPIMGGVVLGSEKVKKNASLEVILEKVKDEIETKLNQFLFVKHED
ncbi:MAG TPA: V-type ATP synthase subunit E [Atribacterota bacterium]|nr:V-type ATP synthase subunit E [Atribacterota bacterium]